MLAHKIAIMFKLNQFLFNLGLTHAVEMNAFKQYTCIILYSMMASVLGDNFTLNDDGDVPLKGRIVGGFRVQISDYPYTVNFEPAGCGGVILSSVWILTAAHCTSLADYVLVGSTARRGGDAYWIKRKITHPNYNDKQESLVALDYDYQLLELEEPLKFGPTVQPVEFGTDADTAIGNVATIVGWGSIQEDGPASNMLKAAKIYILPKYACNWFLKKDLSSRVLCGGVLDGSRDSCQGDSGGPMIVNNRLIGIVSSGLGCALPEHPGFYANVLKAKDWIKQVTGI